MKLQLVRGGRLALLLSLLAGAASAQEAAGGPRLKAGVAEIEIGGRVQTQLNTTSVEGEPGSELFLRRVRLEAKVKVNDLVSGKIQPDFAGDRVAMKDAYIRLDFAPAFALLAGKAYRPFSLLEQTSSNRILPIERGADVRGVAALDEYEIVHGLGYSDRDIGLQLLGAPGWAPLGLTYAAGVFRGPLHGRIGAGNSYQFAARTTLRVHPEVAVGLGWSNRDFARELGPGSFAKERGNAVELDVEYGAFDPGVHLLAEATVGDFDPLEGESFRGMQAWLAYRTARVGVLSTVEPMLRVSYGDVDSERPAIAGAGGTLVTPGINLYFGGLNRLMLNYDVWRPGEGGGGRESSLKAQFQLAF